MALQREIWIKSIVEGLFPDNSFVSRSVDHSEFVNNKTVHVPNAGTAPVVTKGRSTFPATVKTQTDIDLNYSINEYTIDPIRISNAEKVELSYNKRESIIAAAKESLADKIATDLVYSWIPSSPNKYETTGKEEEAHIKGATGNRKAMTKKDVEALQYLFDEQDIPQAGRYILLDAKMYNQLKNSLTDAETNHFLSGADPSKGVIGQYASFKFYMRSKVAKCTQAGNLKEWGASEVATDKAAGIAWWDKAVSRAMGDSVLYDNQGNPLYYGDVISFLQRAGGSAMRSDKKGVILIVQG